MCGKKILDWLPSSVFELFENYRISYWCKEMSASIIRAI